ncbi:hypothetical protein [Candidatus Palauibacter sp.]|uniref:hypothetical protein n=1 Tax=Candidatus Palauibacter sp. TaxID=3101350 RepID=UPI003D107BCB
MEIIISAATAWALTHLYHRRAKRQADLRHETTKREIAAEFKRIPELPPPRSGDDQAWREFRQQMRANALEFVFGVVLRRHPETRERAVGAVYGILESAREGNDNPERIRAIEDVLTFLRSPPR